SGLAVSICARLVLLHSLCLCGGICPAMFHHRDTKEALRHRIDVAAAFEFNSSMVANSHSSEPAKVRSATRGRLRIFRAIAVLFGMIAGLLLVEAGLRIIEKR